MMEQKESRETDWFKMPSGLFLRTILLQNGKVWISVSIALIVIGMLLGVSIDYRYAIIALMILFLLIPLEIAMLYFYYGFLECCYFNAILHKLTFEGSEIKVTMKWTKREEEEEISDGESKAEEEIYRNITFNKELFCKFVVLNDSVVFHMKTKMGFLWLPISAFEDETKFTEFVKEIA